MNETGEDILPALPDVSIPKSHPAILIPAYCTLLVAGAAEVAAAVLAAFVVVVAGLVVVEVTRVEDLAVVVGLAGT